MSSEALRRLEADFQKRSHTPVGAQSPVQIGPKGLIFNIQIGVGIPFNQLLTQKLPNGASAVPDEALKLIVDEVLAEMKARGLKY
jgi:hypothetical protein